MKAVAKKSFSLRRDILQPVVLLTSKEPFRVRSAIEKIAEGISQVPGLELNFEAVEVGYDDIESALARVQTLPLGAEKRILLIRNAQSLNSTQTNLLKEYLEKRASTSSVILAGVGIESKQRLYKLASTYGKVIELGEYTKREYPSLVRSILAEKGKVISNKALAYLLESVGYDLNAIEGAIEKINLCFEEKKRIELEDVVPLISPSVEHSIFELVDQVAIGDTNQSLKLLYNLLRERKEEQDIFFLLVRQFRLLLLYQALQEKRVSPKEIGNYLKVKPFLVERLRNQARRYSLKELKEIYRNLLECDLAMKGGNNKGERPLELLVYRICSRVFKES